MHHRTQRVLYLKTFFLTLIQKAEMALVVVPQSIEPRSEDPWPTPKGM